MPGKELEPKREEAMIAAKEERKEDKKDEKNKKNGKEKKEEELSEEDQQLKSNLDMLVERVQDTNPALSKAALDAIKNEIRSATTSMTSVPKPLKFLRPHFAVLRAHYESLPASDLKVEFADVMSVLAMTMAEEGSRDSLKYRLEGSKAEGLAFWGHEYLRHMAAEIKSEFDSRLSENKPIEDLSALVDVIVPYNMKHNAEVDAVDLLIEVDQLEKLKEHTDDGSYQRVCLYLMSSAAYAADAEEYNRMLTTVFEINMKHKEFPNALRAALKLNKPDLIKSAFDSCDDLLVKKQMAFLLARQRVSIELAEDENDEVKEIISNEKLTSHFASLARDLDVTDAKTPEDIYKAHLEEKSGRGAPVAQLDSAKQNLASTFVNAFVNAGYGKDLLMTPEGNAWLYKNKEHGMLSAAASMGSILLWDVEGGLAQIDKFQYSGEDYIRAGALLALGMVNSGVKNEADPALALLADHLESPSDTLRIGAIAGLGLAYAGAAREDIVELLVPHIVDTSNSVETSALAALSLGLIFAGTCHEDIAQAIMQTLMERTEAQLNVPHARFFALGLGLLFLGQQDTADATLEALKIISHPLGKYSSVTVETCAYAGSGNVLKVQEMLHICAEHLEEKDSAHQMVACVGIALISMGEEIGADMALRSMDHILQYGEVGLRRAVPLAMGLLSVSNPRITVMDSLSKLSHDVDAEVAMTAIFALGLIGAGTNNSRLAGILRQLASYYQKEANHLFIVRIAQGLLHMGKGLISISPFHSDRFLMSPVALSGLLAVVHACFDVKNIILGKSHYMLYYLVCAMYPRMLVTLDEDLKPLPVSVRVGQAVDVVGQAGRPRTITGFQTHTTPVLLGHGERAELATEEYLPLTSVLENFVILKKNPDYKP